VSPLDSIWPAVTTRARLRPPRRSPDGSGMNRGRDRAAASSVACKSSSAGVPEAVPAAGRAGALRGAAPGAAQTGRCAEGALRWSRFRARARSAELRSDAVAGWSVRAALWRSPFAHRHRRRHAVRPARPRRHRVALRCAERVRRTRLHRLGAARFEMAGSVERAGRLPAAAGPLRRATAERLEAGRAARLFVRRTVVEGPLGAIGACADRIAARAASVVVDRHAARMGREATDFTE
jgi:hypothetical protein